MNPVRLFVEPLVIRIDTSPSRMISQSKFEGL